jgi:hypothetical protein
VLKEKSDPLSWAAFSHIIHGMKLTFLTGPFVALCAVNTLIVFSGCSESVQGSNAGSGGESGGGNSGGGTGSGGESSDGGTGSGGENSDGGTGSGGDETGGAPSGNGGEGTGGTTEPPTVTCGGLEYSAPENASDWGCQDFDGTWPPSSPWSVTGQPGDLDISTSLFRSSPNALQLDIPNSGSVSSKVIWSNTGGANIVSVRIEFEINPNTLPAAPPPWGFALNIACVDFGQIEGCLAYQWGGGGYLIQITNNITIPTVESCNIAGSPAAGSWNHVIVQMDDTGEVLVEIDGVDPTTCQGPNQVNGTIASAWLGQEGPDDNRAGYHPHLDNFFVIVERD